KFLSRCIDDRYQNDINLSPLALPGADAGELAILFTAANEFGFELIEEKAYQVLIDVVGGVKNLHFHTSKRQELDPIGGCSHFQQFSLHPEAYHLEKEQIEFIKIKVKNSVILGAEDEVLAGDHLRGAVLQIRGNYGVYPAYAIEIKDGRERVGFFEYHETLVGERHKVLAKKLVQEHAVKLYQGCDEEYLYEALCEITDEHFFETVRRLGKGIPLYSVIFNNDGSFIIKDRGLV
ncbi:hypothetical protein HY041_04480, partial [Candidatus Roizmanbacteria bacterium]|nr:hypothetical protein [Candidatus Roizmanbacteria bacterium]